MSLFVHSIAEQDLRILKTTTRLCYAFQITAAVVMSLEETALHFVDQENEGNRRNSVMSYRNSSRPSNFHGEVIFQKLIFVVYDVPIKSTKSTTHMAATCYLP